MVFRAHLLSLRRNTFNDLPVKTVVFDSQRGWLWFRGLMYIFIFYFQVKKTLEPLSGLNHVGIVVRYDFPLFLIFCLAFNQLVEALVYCVISAEKQFTDDNARICQENQRLTWNAIACFV